MNTPEIVVRLVAGVLLILTNGFFVAIEFALTRARQFTEGEFVDGDSRLERAWSMTQDLELYLTTCQVGITASSIAVGIVAEPALAALFEPLFAGSTLATIGAGALIAYLIINLVHLTHGEQAPTYLGVERSRLVCRYGAAPLYWFYVIISPLIKLGDVIAKWTLRLFGVEMTGAWLETEEDAIESRADLRNRLGSVLNRGDLPEDRREEVMAAVDIGSMETRDVMVDADSIVTLSVVEPLAVNLERMREDPHSRFPLVGESLEDFRGIVYTPAVLRDQPALEGGDATLSDVATDPMWVEASLSVSELIDRFQEAGQELALVTDGDAVVGLVTVTDAVEAITGEVTDPLDDEKRGDDPPS
jgi:CBS domain containing-hemolysin-like protein